MTPALIRSTVSNTTILLGPRNLLTLRQIDCGCLASLIRGQFVPSPLSRDKLAFGRVKLPS
jgi:hypothetical protein